MWPMGLLFVLVTCFIHNVSRSVKLQPDIPIIYLIDYREWHETQIINQSFEDTFKQTCLHTKYMTGPRCYFLGDILSEILVCHKRISNDQKRVRNRDTHDINVLIFI